MHTKRSKLINCALLAGSDDCEARSVPVVTW